MPARCRWGKEGCRPPSPAGEGQTLPGGMTWAERPLQENDHEWGRSLLESEERST